MPKITAKPLIQIATTRLDIESYEGLNLKAEDKGISISNLIRKIILDYLKSC